MQADDVHSYLLRRCLSWLFWALLTAEVLWPALMGLFSSIAIDLLTPVHPPVVPIPDRAVTNLINLVWMLGALLGWLVVSFSLVRIARLLERRLAAVALGTAAGLVILAALSGLLLVFWPTNGLLRSAYRPLDQGGTLFLLLGLRYVMAMERWWVWLHRIAITCTLLAVIFAALMRLVPSTIPVLLPLTVVTVPAPLLTLVLVGAMVLATRPPVASVGLAAFNPSVFLIDRALRRLFWILLSLTIALPGVQGIATFSLPLQSEWFWTLLRGGLAGLLLVATALLARSAQGHGRLWLLAAVACFVVSSCCDLFNGGTAGLSMLAAPTLTDGGLHGGWIDLVRLLTMNAGLLSLVGGIGCLFRPPRWWLWLRGITIVSLFISAAIAFLRLYLSVPLSPRFGVHTLGTLASFAGPPLLIILVGQVLLFFHRKNRDGCERRSPRSALPTADDSCSEK